MSDYVCPNGHPFPSVVTVKCEQCNATVGCEPAARGMAAERQRPRSITRKLAHTDPAWAVDRILTLEREVGRLRTCAAAALERVELLDGGERDGHEAEAILREALDGDGR